MQSDTEPLDQEDPTFIDELKAIAHDNGATQTPPGAYGESVFSTRRSGPDDDGERTAPELDVPDDLLSKGDIASASGTESPEGELSVDNYEP